MAVCFFIGHRDAPNTVKPILGEAIERHITQYRVTEFIVGRLSRDLKCDPDQLSMRLEEAG